MIKKATFFCFIFILTTLILSLFNISPTYTPQFNKIDNIKYEKKEETDPLIDRFNIVNNKINSISYNNNKIYVNNISVKSNISYEKPLNFRMISKSILGVENDIGSNENEFWFWSKRMKPSYLFYSNHENLKKTRLRTPFNPHWMMQILGINEVKNFNKSFYYKNYLAVVFYDKNNYNKKITKIQLIDTDKNCLYGHYIFNEFDELIISAEITDYYSVNEFNVPKTIFINWFEENLIVKWELGDVALNKNLDNSLWIMPNNYEKVNLIGYSD